LHFRENFRYYGQFSLRNFRENENKFSRKCENALSYHIAHYHKGYQKYPNVSHNIGQLFLPKISSPNLYINKILYMQYRKFPPESWYSCYCKDFSIVAEPEPEEAASFALPELRPEPHRN
jgi:hypothetical protein